MEKLSVKQRVEAWSQRVEAKHPWVAPLNRLAFGPVVAVATVTRAATGNIETYKSRGRVRFAATSSGG